LLAEFLLDWKRKTELIEKRIGFWLSIFASPFMAGKSPYFSTAIRRKIHAAGERAGLAHLLKGEPAREANSKVARMVLKSSAAE